MLSLSFFILVSLTNFGQVKITITGGRSIVCPGYDPDRENSYTAKATYSFLKLPVNGCFFWSILENGTWNDLDPDGCTASSPTNEGTAVITWNSTGASQIKVIFVPNNFVGGIFYTAYKNVAVQEFNPGQIKDSDGGLGFCSSGETKTLTVPGISNSVGTACVWHHKYTWEAPVGWTIFVNGQNRGQTYTGGRSVQVRAQASSLASKYSGNYWITVRTEDAWPWPGESRRRVWVGKPDMGSNTVEGPEQLTPGLRATYVVNGTRGATSYNWTIPSGCYSNYCWEIVSGQGTKIINIAAGDPGYEAIQSRALNKCGSDSRYLFVTVQDSGSGGGSGGSGDPDPCVSTLSISANPHQKGNGKGNGGGVVVYVIEPPDDPCQTMLTTSENEPINIVEVYNQQGELKFHGEYKDDEFTIEDGALDNGVNVLFVQHKGELLTKRILIN